MSDTERDELVEVIDGSAIRLITGVDELDAYYVADAILAAGYRKPQQVTTVEELDALPHGSVIRSSHRHYWVAHKEDGEGGNQGWAAAGTGRIPSLAEWLPATVLHIGGTK